MSILSLIKDYQDRVIIPFPQKTEKERGGYELNELTPCESADSPLERTDKTDEPPLEPAPVTPADKPILPDAAFVRDALKFWSQDHRRRFSELAREIEAEGMAHNLAARTAFAQLVYEPQRFAAGELDPFGL